MSRSGPLRYIENLPFTETSSPTDTVGSAQTIPADRQYQPVRGGERDLHGCRRAGSLTKPAANRNRQDRGSPERSDDVLSAPNPWPREARTLRMTTPAPNSAPEAKPRLVRDLSREDSRELLAVNWAKAQPSLTAFLIASTPQFSDAEDLLQEVAAEVARRFDDYDASRPFLPWALWVAKIKIANFYRARERSPVKFIGDSIDALAEACDRVQMTLSEEKWALEKCLNAVTGRSRELLQLRYFEDMGPQEISDRVGMTPGAVRIALSRIRSALITCVRSSLTEASGPHG